MNSFTAFLKGLKPAYMATHMYEQREIERLKNMGYAYAFVEHDYGGSTIFFANKELRDRYISSIAKLEQNSKEEIYFTGTVLGYPPIACRFFADYMANEDYEEWQHKKAGYMYYGIEFVGNVDDHGVISQWLWSNVPIKPGPVEMTYRKKKTMIWPKHVGII